MRSPTSRTAASLNCHLRRLDDLGDNLAPGTASGNGFRRPNPLPRLKSWPERDWARQFRTGDHVGSGPVSPTSTTVRAARPIRQGRTRWPNSTVTDRLGVRLLTQPVKVP